jgi:hypothetical protein
MGKETKKTYLGGHTTVRVCGAPFASKPTPIHRLKVATGMAGDDCTVSTPIPVVPVLANPRQPIRD